MRILENDCVNCEHCVNCGNKRVLHTYCDLCKEEFDADELRNFDGVDACEECILGNFEKIDVEYDMYAGDDE